MNSQAVLVLGNHANRDLAEALSHFGFIPQVWGSIGHSLDKLRRQKFGAILVDRKYTRADVLEFILNVRDIDEQVPVLVVGPGPESIDKKITKQARTAILKSVDDGTDLAEKLRAMGPENGKAPAQTQT